MFSTVASSGTVYRSSQHRSVQFQNPAKFLHDEPKRTNCLHVQTRCGSFNLVRTFLCSPVGSTSLPSEGRNGSATAAQPIFLGNQFHNLPAKCLIKQADCLFFVENANKRSLPQSERMADRQDLLKPVVKLVLRNRCVFICRQWFAFGFRSPNQHNKPQQVHGCQSHTNQPEHVRKAGLLEPLADRNAEQNH